MSATPPGWEEIKRLFEHALELDPSKRSEYLRENAHDLAARAEVERLISEHGEGGTFLSVPVIREITADAEFRIKLSVGDTVAGRFRIIRFIAAGGMGEVYEADDLELRERVAIKTIPDRLLNPRAISGLRREVQLARKVSHPNVCRVFDLFRRSNNDSDKDTLFVSMELLHGKTLSTYLRERGAFSLPEATPLMRQLAAGLRAAHEAAVIHGDFKPGNVFLEDPSRPNGTTRAVITDFGLAVPSGDFATSSGATLSTLWIEGGVRGTPAYMAPEQLQGKRATVASDIYAFGLVVYEMTTGIRAFSGDNIPLLMNAILTKKPTPPSSLKEDLPANLSAVILKALEKDPEHRYESLDQFMEALEEPTLDAGANKSAVLPTRSNWKRSVALAAFLILLLASVVGYSYRRLFVADQSHNQLTRTSLTFSIVAQQYLDGKARGEPYPVSDQQAFSAGTGIHLILSSPEPGFLYILNEAPASTDSAPIFNVIFPSPFTHGGSARLEQGKDLTVPENGPLVFDNNKGTERIWLVWSKRSLQELETLKRWANEYNRGRISDRTQALRIKSFLGASELSSPNASIDSVNRTRLVVSGDTLVYRLQLNHT